MFTEAACAILVLPCWCQVKRTFPGGARMSHVHSLTRAGSTTAGGLTMWPTSPVIATVPRHAVTIIHR